jgi:quinol monooxygenase YgiN
VAETVVFISRNRIKPGKLAELERTLAHGSDHIHATKPETTAFLIYLDEEAQEVCFVHLFRDAAGMDRHLEGAAERAQRAYELMEPHTLEVFGEPSEAAVAMMRQSAAASGAELILRPRSIAGFLRT